VERHAALEFKTLKVQSAMALENVKRDKGKATKNESCVSAIVHHFRYVRQQAEAMAKVLQVRCTILQVILEHKDDGTFLELFCNYFPWEYMGEEEVGFPLFESICGYESGLSVPTQSELEDAIREIKKKEAKVQKRINESMKSVE